MGTDELPTQTSIGEHSAMLFQRLFKFDEEMKVFTVVTTTKCRY